MVFGAQWLATVGSPDGSGHGDLAQRVFEIAGMDRDEAARSVEEIRAAEGARPWTDGPIRRLEKRLAEP